VVPLLGFSGWAIFSLTGAYSYAQTSDTKEAFLREGAYITEQTVIFAEPFLSESMEKLFFEKAYGPATEEWGIPNTRK